MHLPRERVNVHRAHVLLHELVHFDRVAMRIKSAEKAMGVIHRGGRRSRLLYTVGTLYAIKGCLGWNCNGIYAQQGHA
jgi:hypothetical protein